MRTWMEHRHLLSVLVSAAVGLAAFSRLPFPGDNNILLLVWLEKPYIFLALKYGYIALWFTTPWILCSVLFSLAYIFVVREEDRGEPQALPPYPDPRQRLELSVVLGEVHHAKKHAPALHPYWLTIPDRGLYTGMVIVGAVGSGKTSGCMYPYAEQVLAYQARNPEKKVGGLVLEVKGDFCRKLQAILEKHGRTEDYVEISLEATWRYNPLHNDLDAFAQAYGIASLLNNLYGRGKEPFWQQAYTNLVKFIILLHRVLYDYVTLFDIYECAINADQLRARMREAEAMFVERQFLLIRTEQFVERADLEEWSFEKADQPDSLRAPYSDELRAALDEKGVDYQVETETGGTPPKKTAEFERKRQEYEAVHRWYHYDWLKIENKLRTSIVEGISVFLSLFDDNPTVKYMFCPPKEVYDPERNRDGRLGRPLPSFATLIEQGSVVALNFPVSANPGLAKTIGTLLKQDFQRAVLNRIPAMERNSGRHFRPVLFLCDEYQSFATVGESDPTGDEKFFSLSRQAKCVAIVATQSLSSLKSTLPGESWRTLLQTFRTKVFLSLSDDFSARTASELCGKEEMLKASYSLSENGQDARVSVLTGRATAHRATVSTSKSYQTHRDFVFEPKVFGELKNAQAVVLAYDGLNPWPPTYCYLKPYYLPVEQTYFEQLAQGLI